MKPPAASRRDQPPAPSRHGRNSRRAATSRLHQAILCGRRSRIALKEAEAAFRAGADLDKTIPNTHETPLIYACARGRGAAVRWLLEHGANPNAATQAGPPGRTALMSAAAAGDAKIAQVLLEHGADPNARSQYGWTALMAAAHGRYTKVVQSLLEHGADPNIQDAEAQTAMAYAVWAEDTETVILLLGHGADPSRHHGPPNPLPEYLVDTGRQNLLVSLDVALAHPARTAARQHLMSTLTVNQQKTRFPRCHAAEATALVRKSWSRNP